MFKSVAREEFTATNGNVVRLDIDHGGNLKVCARKGAHNQSVSVIPACDVPAVIAFITGGAK